MHTPGPWKLQEGFLTVYTHSHGDVGLTIALANVLDGQLIADQHDVPGKEAAREQAEANAHLITAAPDLLAALEAIVDDLLDGDHISAEQTARHAGKDAVAKAKAGKG